MAWVMDIRHRLDEDGRPVEGGSVGNQVRLFGSIAAAGSVHRVGEIVPAAIRCWRRPKRRPCPGWLLIQRRQDNAVVYGCPMCLDDGLVHSWEGTCFDHSGLLDAEASGNHSAVISIASFEALVALAPALPPAGRAILAGATMPDEDVDLVGPAESFVEVVRSAIAEAKASKSRRKRELLMEAALCIGHAPGPPERSPAGEPRLAPLHVPGDVLLLEHSILGIDYPTGVFVLRALVEGHALLSLVGRDHQGYHPLEEIFMVSVEDLGAFTHTGHKGRVNP